MTAQSSALPMMVGASALIGGYCACSSTSLTTRDLASAACASLAPPPSGHVASTPRALPPLATRRPSLAPSSSLTLRVLVSSVFYRAQEPALVRAQSNAQAEKPKKALVRRHSSGDHAFLPQRQDRNAIKAAQKNFGVPQNLVQDGEGTRLPTTRGY